jgi:hypothetical protein
MMHALLDLPAECGLDVNLLAHGSETSYVYRVGWPVLHKLAPFVSDRELVIRIAERSNHWALHCNHWPVCCRLARRVPPLQQNIDPDSGGAPFSLAFGPAALAHSAVPNAASDAFMHVVQAVFQAAHRQYPFAPAPNERAPFNAEFALAMLDERVARADGSGFDPEGAHCVGGWTPNEAVDRMTISHLGAMSALAVRQLASVERALRHAIERRTAFRVSARNTLHPSLKPFLPVNPLRVIVIDYFLV